MFGRGRPVVVYPRRRWGRVALGGGALAALLVYCGVPANNHPVYSSQKPDQSTGETEDAYIPPPDFTPETSAPAETPSVAAPTAPTLEITIPAAAYPADVVGANLCGQGDGQALSVVPLKLAPESVNGDISVTGNGVVAAVCGIKSELLAKNTGQKLPAKGNRNRRVVYAAGNTSIFTNADDVQISLVGAGRIDKPFPNLSKPEAGNLPEGVVQTAPFYSAAKVACASATVHFTVTKDGDTYELDTVPADDTRVTTTLYRDKPVSNKFGDPSFVIPGPADACDKPVANHAASSLELHGLALASPGSAKGVNEVGF